MLFLQGGAHTQFSMVPMNLMPHGVADYIITGVWAKKAWKEAQMYGQANAIASSADRNFSYIPDCSDLPVSENADYVYICENNTIYGTKFKQQPNTKGQTPQPALLRGRIMPEIHMHAPVTGCPASFAGSKSTVSPTRPNRARHQSPRYPRSGGCPCFPECLEVPVWKPAGRPPRHPGRST